MDRIEPCERSGLLTDERQRPKSMVCVLLLSSGLGRPETGKQAGVDPVVDATCVEVVSFVG